MELPWESCVGQVDPGDLKYSGRRNVKDGGDRLKYRDTGVLYQAALKLCDARARKTDSEGKLLLGHSLPFAGLADEISKRIERLHRSSQFLHCVPSVRNPLDVFAPAMLVFRTSMNQGFPCFFGN